MSNRKENKRTPYFDFLRGLAILMVVGIHTYPDGHQLAGSGTEILQLVLINVSNCAVPLFLTLSGFFIARKNLNTFTACRSFWKKQIPTVYVPCIVFSLPWFVISCVSVQFELGMVIKKLMLLFLCGYSIYYFIALIIECYILAPILVRHNNITTLCSVVIISVVAKFGLDYIRFVQGINLPLIVRGAFPPLLIFFYLGIYLSKHSRDYSLSIPIGMIIVGIILGMIHMEYIRNHFGVSATGQKLSLYIFDIGAILLCMSQKCESLYRNSPLNRIILYLGEISFGVYFTHVYLIFLADRFFPWMRGNWFILWSFSLLFTIGVITLCKKIAPTFSRKFLGYR